jgi:SAM-dependent methyltransferase
MSQIPGQCEAILKMANAYKQSAVLVAAAELELFAYLDDECLSASQLAEQIEADPRAMRMLLDALVSLAILEKMDDRYRLPGELAPWLLPESPTTLVPIIQHLGCIMRGWDQLAWTVKSGVPTPRASSIRGPLADRESFIAGMHSVSGPVAAPLVERFGPPEFKHLLDVGGASGTWTLAFLEARPEARATIFDLPDGIQQAKGRIANSRFADRIELVAGDFYCDRLPEGADLAWVSGIIHQDSRAESRELFAKVHDALDPGGQIAIRDFVMRSDRVFPTDGALFAINMLVNTARGGTFTFDEIAEDLRAVGFVDPEWTVRDSTMNSIVTARK